MIVGILKEQAPERRVSMLPEQAETLVKKQVTVMVESEAGLAASANDMSYLSRGVKPATREDVLRHSDIVLSIHPLAAQDLAQLKVHAITLGVFQPLYNPAYIGEQARAGLTCFSMDMIPRTTRAQSMDVLSSQANIAGYKAVLLAANLYPRYFPMLMTAAGSITPAKLLVIGAGVAGLQAIATARRLGAVVEVFDTRPAVKEEVMSLGAKFVEVEGAADASAAGGYAVEQSAEYQRRQREKISESIAKADVVITTAQIPGKPAPKLIGNDMLARMKAGSVIIDLAAATGGNTEVTRNNETIEHNGVTIVGSSNLPSSMPFDSSRLYGKNILNFLQLLITKEGNLHLNFDDDLVKGTCMCHAGRVTHERIQQLLNA